MIPVTFRHAIVSTILICGVSASEAIADQVVRQQYCESVLLSFSRCALEYKIADLQQKIDASGGEPQSPLEPIPSCVEIQKEHVSVSSALADDRGATDSAFMSARANIDQQWGDAIKTLPRQKDETDKSLQRRTYLSHHRLIDACEQLKKNPN